MMNILSKEIATDAQPTCKKEIETNDPRKQNRKHHYSARLVRITQGFYEYVLSVIHIYIHAFSLR